MKFYDHAGTALVHGSCLDVASLDGFADIIVTDPPYARSGAAHTGRGSTNWMQDDDVGQDQFWQHWFTDVCRKVFPLVRPDGCGFVFCDYRTVHLVDRALTRSAVRWSLSQCLVWDRDSMGLGSPFRASHELVAFVRGPDFKWAGRRDMRNVLRFRFPYGEHEHHGSEKPTSVLRYLIEQTTAPGALVLDPFAGSGSTLVAAKECGRRAIGFEMDEGTARRAAERLSSVDAQGGLFAVGEH